MKKLFLSALFVMAGSFVFSSAGFAASGETYYTRFNMWYENPSKILSTNYHKGAVLPVGTEVEIVKRSDKKITFREKTKGQQFKVVLVRKYTNLTSTEFFDRYFSKGNVLQSAEYAAFSDKEKENIKDGTIEAGMSKAAVLMAFGYPPTHRTPATTDNLWTYWTSRLVTREVYFKDDKISAFSRFKS